MNPNSFGSLSQLPAGGTSYDYFRLSALTDAANAKFVWTGRAKFVWTGVAAAAMLALGVSLARHTPQIARPVTSAPVELPVAAAFAPGADAMSTTDARARAVAEFARFEPPAYRGGTSRAVSTDTMRQFRWAMSAYQSGDFAAAARGLHPLAGAGPGAAEARFFLGISELQLGHTDQGIAELRAVARLGDTSYLEEANYFLSKALLSKQDVQEAERTLDDLVRIGGDREHDAQALLQKVRDLRAR